MPAMSESFVHLRTRSAYSLLEGAIKADKLGALAAAEKMPAVAITDRANLFGALEFSVITKDQGVQPIVGCALPISGIGEGPPERWAKVPTIVLLAPPHRSVLGSLSRRGGDGRASRTVGLGGGKGRGSDPSLRRRGRPGGSTVRVRAYG